MTHVIYPSTEHVACISVGTFLEGNETYDKGSRAPRPLHTPGPASVVPYCQYAVELANVISKQSTRKQ